MTKKQYPKQLFVSGTSAGRLYLSAQYLLAKAQKDEGHFNKCH